MILKNTVITVTKPWMYVIIMARKNMSPSPPAKKENS